MSTGSLRALIRETHASRWWLHSSALPLGTALRGTGFPPGLEELCTPALAFPRAGNPIWKAAANWDVSHNLLFRQQARQGCLCLKNKALSLKCAFQLKAIFLHHTCLLHEASAGQDEGYTWASKHALNHFPGKWKIVVHITPAEKGNGAQGEEDWECCDLRALKTVLITLRGVPNAPCLSRSLQVISVQASYAALCYSHGKCGR